MLLHKHEDFREKVVKVLESLESHEKPINQEKVSACNSETTKAPAPRRTINSDGARMLAAPPIPAPRRTINSDEAGMLATSIVTSNSIDENEALGNCNNSSNVKQGLNTLYPSLCLTNYEIQEKKEIESNSNGAWMLAAPPIPSPRRTINSDAAGMLAAPPIVDLSPKPSHSSADNTPTSPTSTVTSNTTDENEALGNGNNQGWTTLDPSNYEIREKKEIQSNKNNNNNIILKCPIFPKWSKHVKTELFGEMRSVIGHDSTHFLFMRFGKIQILRKNYATRLNTILIQVKDGSKAQVVKELKAKQDIFLGQNWTFRADLLKVTRIKVPPINYVSSFLDPITLEVLLVCFDSKEN